MSSKRIFTYREAKDRMPRVRDLTYVAFQRTEELVRDLQAAELTPERRTDVEGICPGHLRMGRGNRQYGGRNQGSVAGRVR